MELYPYEFEIDSSLRLASIDGVKVSNNDEEKVTISAEEYNNLKKDIEDLKTQVNSLTSVDTYTFENNYLENVVFKKIGNVKEIKIAEYAKDNVTLTAGTAYQLGILPDEYRPKINVNHTFLMTASTSVSSYRAANIIIYTDGRVVFTPYSEVSSSKGQALTLTYL